MRNLKIIVFLFALLMPGLAAAQCSSPLPANTVMGRLSIGPGPCEAIPFADLFAQAGNTTGLPATGSTSVPLFATGVAGASPVYRAIVGSDLPNPSTTTLGGLFSLPVASNSILSGIGNDGTPTRATTTGTGDAVRATAPTVIGPFAVVGTENITSNASFALTVGRQGVTAPAFMVDSSAANSITGLVVSSQASGNGVNLTGTGETNVPLIINGAGNGTINFGTTSTGALNSFRNFFVNHDSTPTLTLGSAGGTQAVIATPGTSGLAFNSNGNTQLKIVDTPSANRQITLTGSNGGNPTINTTGGNLAITPAVVGAAGINGSMAANSIKCNNTGSPATSIDCTTAQSQTALLGAIQLGKLTSANFNSTADQSITITSPSAAGYMIDFFFVANASASLSSAVGGVYVGASKTGAVALSAASTYPVTATTVNTTANSAALGGTRVWLNAATLFFSLTTPQGSAATADIYVFGRPLY